MQVSVVNGKVQIEASYDEADKIAAALGVYRNPEWPLDESPLQMAGHIDRALDYAGYHDVEALAV